MSLTIELPPSLEKQVRSEAERVGVDAAEFALRTLQDSLAQPEPQRYDSTEDQLLREINVGLTAEEWERYRALVAKRQAGSLTSEEQARLIAYSDQVETLNARRIELLAELASIRSKSLPDLMADLGITAPRYA